MKYRPKHLWLGYDEEDLNKGKWQSIEYEKLLVYCPHCEHQGLVINDCTIKARDEEFCQKKEVEAGQKGKANAENKNKDVIGSTSGEMQQGKQTINTTSQMRHEQEILEQGDKWQTQKIKPNKQQEQIIPKTVRKAPNMQQKKDLWRFKIQSKQV